MADTTQKNQSSRFHGLSTGITTIIVMFAVLCMAILAVLSVSTAAQEKKLADKYALSVSDYWAADSAASETAELFGRLWESGADIQALENAAAENGAVLSETDTGVLVSYSQTIDEQRLISVVLELGGEFTVKSWRTMNIADWTPDESLKLWTGEELIS